MAAPEYVDKETSSQNAHQPPGGVPSQRNGLARTRGPCRADLLGSVTLVDATRDDQRNDAVVLKELVNTHLRDRTRRKNCRPARRRFVAFSDRQPLTFPFPRARIIPTDLVRIYAEPTSTRGAFHRAGRPGWWLPHGVEEAAMLSKLAAAWGRSSPAVAGVHHWLIESPVGAVG